MNTKILIILTILVFTNGKKMCLMSEYRIHLCVNNASSSSPASITTTNRGQLNRTRIVGGIKASIAEVPYQLSIEIHGKHICGASIISRNWALSAAHCFPDTYPFRLMKIRSGTSIASYYGKVHNLKKVIIHKNYNTLFDGTPVNDIAAINVRQPFRYSFGVRQRILLSQSREEIPAGTIAMISGWGMLAENHSEASLDLRKAELPVISRKDCLRIYKKLPLGQICAGYENGGIDACSGDSGGPFTIDKKLAGIVSWGVGCARPNRPGVYTDVAYYRQWIKKQTGV